MTGSQMKLNLQGLISAPHTPMHDDGSLNLDAVQRQADWLSRSGVVGVFLGGTTGEWSSMTTSERARLQSAWGQLETPLKRIAHVGHNCQQDAIDLATHAARAGLDAISAVAPSFLKPGSAKCLAEFFAPIAEAAPHIPFYVYHIPGLSGVNIPPMQQIEACAKTIPTFAGVKFTDPDVHAFARCQAAYGRDYELMWGVDELLLAALPYGAVSAVGSTYNYAAPLYNDMIEAHTRGDHERARRQSERVVAMVDLLIEYGVLAAGKALMSLRGVDCGPVRSPAKPLSEERRLQLFDRVVAGKYLDPVPEIVITNAKTPKLARKS